MGYLVLLLIAWPSALQAMSIRTSTRFAAWSADYRAAAFIEEASGPEGGGSVALIITSLVEDKTSRFLFSSTFSPGNGSTPEAVKLEACKQSTAKAEAMLATLRFDAITLVGKNCAGKRNAIIDTPSDAPMPTAWMPSETPRLALENGTLLWNDGVVSASTDTNATKLLTHRTKPPYFEIYRTPHDAALVIAISNQNAPPIVVRRDGGRFVIVPLQEAAP